jgi:acetylornithine deacetylase/succinyl-diaminopimelate desuccinylase-like protein
VSQQLVDKANASITDQEIEDLLLDMVRMPSPTGQEEPLARLLVERLAADGLSARYQPLGPLRGNAIAQLAGESGGPHLLLYASIDSHATGRQEEDALGLLPAPDLSLNPTVSDGQIIGLGAQNPKGFAVCVAAAIIAVHRGGIQLRGMVTAGLVSGGNPDLGDPRDAPESVGFGIGGERLLDEIGPDHAVIAKGSWAVSAVEPGLCWIKLTVQGLPGYAGTRHLAPYRNAVVDAAKVIGHLEEWFPTYAEEHAAGGVTPRAIVGAVRGGWPRKPAFIPEVCEIFVDLRVAPGEEPADAHAALEGALAELRQADPGLRLASEVIASQTPQSTADDAWIVGSTVRAWEAIEGRPHEARSAAAGVTDALVLRRAGIPTAKIGLPKGSATPAGLDRFTMGVVDIASLRKLTELLIRVIIDSGTSSDSKRSVD